MLEIYATCFDASNEVSDDLVEFQEQAQAVSSVPKDDRQNREAPLASDPKRVEPPEEVVASSAAKWNGRQGVDMRPHLWDGVRKQHLLVDSGSQCTTYPPDQTDKVIPGMYLKAVNGTKIPCYGFRKVNIRLGRKQYEYKAIVSDVPSPVIGWDFIDKYRLDWRWNEWGDILLVDKKAKTSQLMTHRSIPVDKSLQMSSLSLVWETPTPESASMVVEGPQTNHHLLFDIAAMQELGEELPEQTTVDMPESIYKTLLQKYPGVLKADFKTEEPKNGIKHRIRTGSHAPCRAKARNLLPGSPKAIEGHKAWKQLIDLGIVEPVDPAKPNHWSSPLHLAPKPGGGLRPVGDYRELNLKT